ncbi:cob(I)yrinic acid a,c-diamide adenosyltransferase [Zavarzinia compransoris]|uniref:Corrinoid adenosyltransferase n=1 Tax=Zavarzinia compransoris TaxID=1264899 RepID=A0A317E5H5_9PROT|nr:cob(I)yrinic acid a,c-diamide adenosyltransferase [Zavarzinia compransoris]PWR21852.1 cob(I)yrinic acid a,c-diamide adenosyltransferase [Zavarzinia compransoris]TDP45343.1 ATP:cob(I)alamin adenosyltransferase [Zavarzinia compransoris]
MVKLDKIYTRGGDKGLTSLVDGSRVPKHADRVAAYGEVDELNAAIGLIRLEVADRPEVDAMLGRIQNDLFDLGADLATPEGIEGALRIVEAQVTRLEGEIDGLNAGIPPLRSFILPGGSRAAAFAHQARTVARRAERAVSALAAVEAINMAALRYVNRLSDHLFVLARHLNDNGAADVLWVPGANR